jgi:hypothetical protein
VLIGLNSAAYAAEPHDKTVSQLPNNLTGDWCAVDEGAGLGSGFYKRCKENRDLHIERKSFSTDTYCEITIINMAPDHTYFFASDCKAEGSNKTVSVEMSSIRLVGDVLGWTNLPNLCGGNSDDFPGRMDCIGKMDTLGRELKKLGYCYGKIGQAHADLDWHTCTSNSLRD